MFESQQSLNSHTQPTQHTRTHSEKGERTRVGRKEGGLTSLAEMISFQYKLLSFLMNPPPTFLLLTLTITSPATQSGDSSASPSNTTSEPSGIPLSMWRTRSDCVSTTLCPLHNGQRCLTDLPRP